MIKLQFRELTLDDNKMRSNCLLKGLDVKLGDPAYGAVRWQSFSYNCETF